MNTNRSVRVKDIVEKFQMEVINKGTDYDTEILTITDVNRPGLQFIGFFDYFDPRRLQIIGKSEVTFLRGYSAEERRKRFEDLFCYEIPALVISRNLDVFPECLEMAQKHGRTLLRTKYTSVEFTAMTIDYLNHALAPVITRHGVLVDVYGEGVLILGDSGIGKSETAIELIKRGHRLIADDAVEIKKVSPRSRSHASARRSPARRLSSSATTLRCAALASSTWKSFSAWVQCRIRRRSTLSSSLKSGRMTNSMTVWVSTKTTRPSLMCPCRRSPFPSVRAVTSLRSWSWQR